MPKAYSYIRFSTPEQRLGDSLRRQMEPARAYADSNGLDLDETLRDEGRSAFRGRQRLDDAALGSFIAKVDRGDVPTGSYLLVESLDRLSREKVLVALRLFLTLLDRGIIIVTLGDGRLYSSDSVGERPFELMISIVIMMRAHEESSIKAKRVGAAWDRKRQLALTERKAMTRVCPAWLEKDADGYRLIAERATVVRRIFAMSIDGMGSRAIAIALNSEKVPVFGRGRYWHDSYVKKLLGNEATIGRFVPGAASRIAPAYQPVDDYFPAVVDERTFYRSLAATRARASSSVRHPAGKVRNLVSGIAFCSECGGGMHYMNKGRRGMTVLQCGSSRLKGGCSNSFKYDYNMLENGLVILCSEAFQDRSEKIPEADLGELMVQRDNLAERLSRLIELVETGELAGQQVPRRIADLEAQLKSADAVIKSKKQAAKLLESENSEKAFDDFFKFYRQMKQDETFVLRRNVAVALRTIIKRVVFDARGGMYFEMRDGPPRSMSQEGARL
ncbi:recombinase family protein [Fulvimarina pelagi]|nr:recombinase family protein [Fulvimarina pelagi]